jgi:chemotaxis signal transduction protein
LTGIAAQPQSTSIMIHTSPNKLPFVIFQVKEGLYAVGSKNVREIVMLPKVVEVPGLPPEIRGVINLRGKVMPLIDLRVKLGLPSAKTELDELIQLLHDREKDHHNWLKELESCVRERRPFKMARNPHACKFGLWYDKFQTDNNLLKMALKKMDEPHKIIHASADGILQMVEQGDMDGAEKLLAARRNGELAELSKLFEEARRILREHQRELAVVLNRGDKRFAISIDMVEAVERIPEEGIEPMPATLACRSEQHQWRIGKRVKTSQTILLMDEDFLFSSGVENLIPSVN